MRKRDWVTMLDYAAAFTEIVWYGNGKDANLTISLADGITYEMGGSSLTVSCVSGLTTKVTRVDDLNVEVRYTGEGVLLRRVEVAFDGGSEEWNNEFVNDLRQWLADNEREAFSYCVDAQITLETAPPALTRAAAD